jgi:hypothetical protein
VAEDAVHVGRFRIARLPAVHDDDPPAGVAERKRGVQPSRAAADDHDVDTIFLLSTFHAFMLSRWPRQ